MADSVKQLKQRRATVKGQVTRILNSLRGDERITVEDARIRLGKLNEAWIAFDQYQIAIDEKPFQDEAELEARIQDGEAERTVFENAYYQAASKAQKIIDDFDREQLAQRQAAQQQQAAQQLQAAQQQQAAEGGPRGAQEHRRVKPKLPQINLPEFDGEYTKWMFFKNSFETTIDGDDDLSSIQKHQYLIGVLRGEALQVIQGFHISDTSYENAWKLLKDTYDNQVMIIETHLDQMLQFPIITKDNKADSIRQFIWHIQTHYKSLEALGQPVVSWETIIIHLAKKKLDFLEQRDWQTLIKDRTPQNMPKLEEFIKFLTERCHSLRLLNNNKAKATNEKLAQQKKNEKSEKKVSLVSTSTPKCKICRGSHAIYRCEELLKLSVSDRLKEVKEKQLCLNCLGSGHYAKNCRSSLCKKCSARHNTILHQDSEQARESENSEAQIVTHVAVRASDDNMREISSNKNEDVASIYYVQKPSARVILSTAKVYAYDNCGKQRVCRVLLDPGSQSNLVTEDFARKLQVQCKSENRPISGINQAQTNVNKITEIRIKSTQTDFTTTIECLVLKSITERLPQQKIDAKRIIMPKDVCLADPAFDEPGTIDLLIGAGVYWKVLLGTPKNRIEGQPALQNTQFGWIVGGEMCDARKDSSAACLAVTNDTLNLQIERFWKMEDIPETRFHTDEEKACEQHFVETFKRDSTGRFIVRLPTKSNVVLGNSREMALRRLISLERRLNNNAELKSEYSKFIDDYIEQEHMTLITEENGIQDANSYFLPHQAVVRPDSMTTKLRVVFDASAKTTFGTSLNDKLMTGPNLQQDIIDIILRFRTYEYVVTADVAKMFRQIVVDKQDRALQRILWRNNPNETIKVFELNTVTYGTTCAPYLAIRCLRQVAVDEGANFPRGAKAIREDCYMDDVLTGANTIEDAIQLQKELSKLLMRGQFHLRKWRSNDQRILQHLEEECQADTLLTIDKQEALKTLGLLWNAATDCLQYQIQVDEVHEVTKRLVLSKIAQVFDPLGLIAPLLISGKIIMQQIWLHDLDWDQPVPQELSTAWEEYYTSLAEVNNLQIPRNVIPKNQSDKLDLFGFGDASEKAYGACLYAISTDRNGEVHSNLICAKAKVAPLKTISLPRLELEAALLLSRLYAISKDVFGDRIGEAKLWSDSTIVLGWIRTQPNALKTFVANRIAKIQDCTKNIAWYHVPSEENPADLLSRGLSIDALKNSKLWWNGPTWLCDEHQWPANMKDPETSLPELKPTTVSLATIEVSGILANFSTYSKLQRVIAYCKRFKMNTLGTKTTGPLSVEELRGAEKTIVMMVQRESFPKEIDDLQKNRVLSRKSKLRALDPFIDDENLIRVGGRLRHASISATQKHPIILPAKHHVTAMIMRHEHVRLHHCPPEQLLNAVRLQFWPISGRRESRKVVKGCLSCFRFRPTIPDVKMGDLPKQRVTGFDRPFTSTGIDYAGPLQVRESRRRGRIHISKGYIAVFTCLSTKAVHLELVSDLTSEAFLAALSRFTARRGICSELFSDNGTNFVGAERELKEIYAFLQKEKDEIETNLARQRISWHFIPPRAPHFGGIWEAAVKITKRHLYTVTQGRVLTFEEYYTLLVEIEAILNSRPLTPLTSDPTDLTVLTPSHFLIGDSLIQPVQPRYLEVPENRLSRWQFMQKLRQQFWDRWQAEYLQELQKRTKWSTSSDNIELNTMVLLKEDHTPPLQWVLGRVIALHPGRDGVVRVVSVRTQSGEFKRAVKKLCPIPMDEHYKD